MITIATMLWEGNHKSRALSRMYDESWVEKLYRCVSRNLTVPFRFVCYVDRIREFNPWAIEQIRIRSSAPSSSDFIQPYELGAPMILVGLDALVIGNIDHLAKKCFNPSVHIGILRDSNGVALVPADLRHVAYEHHGDSAMGWIRRQPHYFIDDTFPNHVLRWSDIKRNGFNSDTSIIYFNGDQKLHQLQDNPIVQRHWI